MRIGILGKKRFAFGLKWTEVHEGTAVALVKEALGGDAKAAYAQITNDDERTVVGYADLASETAAQKGVLYSYAQALAQAGQPGIYVAAVDEAQLWYAVVADGLVVPDTDQTMAIEMAYSAIESLRDALGLDVFVAAGTDLALHGARRFDSEGIIEGVKLKPLKRIGGGNSLGGVLFLAAVIAGIAGGGWYVMNKDKAGGADDPQVQAAALRASYVGGAQSMLASRPTDANWVIAAFRGALTQFPAVISGWRLDGITCQPGNCVGRYSATQGSARALATVSAAFPAGTVTLLEDQNSLTISLPAPAGEPAAWSEDQVLAPLPWPRRAIDTAGGIPIRFLGVELDGGVVTENLGQQMGPPMEAQPLIKERIAVKEAAALDDLQLRGVANYFARDGFVASTLAFSAGTGATPPAWRAEFDRVGGGSP